MRITLGGHRLLQTMCHLVRMLCSLFFSLLLSVISTQQCPDSTHGLSPRIVPNPGAVSICYSLKVDRWRETGPKPVTRQEIEQKMDELAREYRDTHDPEIPEEIYSLAR